ncbi:MAG: DEAD/DEAH box helicase [Thaumarchaeota archaeon]|nr:DEAD/DEAH box helicase [Nitrososphaerota archaeon]
MIADEMGLGKTIEAIGVANLIGARKILVICPAVVKINWVREWSKWGTHNLLAVLIRGRSDNMHIINDDGVVIINYELLTSHAEVLRTVPWDLIVIDEAHYLKNSKADRTGQVFGRKRSTETRPRLSPIPFNRILMMTGTPMTKPKELWPLLQVLDPDGLGSDWFSYARRYCELFEIERFDPARGRKVHMGWKWDGAANLDELQRLMRERFMIRRLKKDVLTELPPKTRQVIELDAKKGLTKLLERERLEYEDYVKKHGEEDIDPPAFSEMSKVIKEVGIAKIPYVIEYLKEVLNETEKVVVWVHHHEVIDSLEDNFRSISVRVDGRSDLKSRQNSIDRFQTDPSISLFIGGIQAAGIGTTLTAAHIAVFAERSWDPKIVTQAEDRLHRKGQKENVLIRHIVLNRSQDQRQVQVLIRKQEIADKGLDDEQI